MKCQFAAVAVTFLAAISPRVVADGSGRRTGFVRTGSTNIFANDDETNVDRNTEEPTEAAEEVAVAVLNQTTIVSNIFIEEEAVGTVAVAAPRDPSNMLTNEIIGGYQGWFAFPDDGAPVNKWRHWFRDPISNTSAPEAKQLGVDLYATTDEYDAEDLHTSSNILLPDGSPAKFFSSARPRVVLKHFEWMANYGITGIFHIRFMQSIDIPANRQWKDMVLRNVKNAAEATGRIFAVSYNVAGCTNDILDDVKNDWIQLVDNEQITQSPRYIRQRGLPVLRIYGIGFKAVNVTDTVQLANLIQWFQKDAPEKYRVFLIGGVPSRWRDRTVDSRGELVWTTIYNSLDGIHPWHVGRWGSIGDFNSYNANIISKDAAYCKDRGILYMPTMWPGFSWHNLKNSTEPINAIPRQGGNFFWKQAHAFAANSNITSVWLAQIDELDEGTAIIKVTAKTSDLPVHGKWLALDADGQSLPSDWYLRLGGEAQRMFEGTRPVTSVIPIKPTDPPPPDSLVKFPSNINDSNSTGARGIMFTITAKQNIVIRGLDIVTRRLNAKNVSIYTLSGSYSNATYSKVGWQRIFQTSLRSELFPNNYNWKLDDVQVKVPIRAGLTQSFYIYNSNGLKFKTGIKEGEAYVEDDAIVIDEGRVTKSFFGNKTVGIGQFAGSVRYYIDRW